MSDGADCDAEGAIPAAEGTSRRRVGVLTVRPDGYVLDADDTATALIGLGSFARLVGARWQELVSPECISLVNDALQLSAAGDPWTGYLTFGPNATSKRLIADLSPPTQNRGLAVLRLAPAVAAVSAAGDVGAPELLERFETSLRAAPGAQSAAAICRVVLRDAVDATAAEWAVVLRSRTEDEPDGADVMAVYPDPVAGLSIGTALRAGGPEMRALLEEGHPSLDEHIVPADDDHSPLADIARSGLQSVVRIPLFSGATIAGAALFYGRGTGAFSAGDAVRLQELTASLGGVITGHAPRDGVATDALLTNGVQSPVRTGAERDQPPTDESSADRGPGLRLQARAEAERGEPHDLSTTAEHAGVVVDAVPTAHEQPGTIELAGGPAGSGIALLIWAMTVARLDPAVPGDLGLLSLPGPTGLATFVLAAAATTFELTRSEPRRAVLGVQAAILVAMLAATPALLTALPGDPAVYRFAGIAHYLREGGAIDSATAIELQWPAFFALWASLSSGVSLGDELAIARWAPLAFDGLAALAAFGIARSLTDSTRIRFLTVVVFVLGAAGLQGGPGPQSLAYIVFLGAVPLAWGGRSRASGAGEGTGASLQVARIGVLVLMFGVLLLMHALTAMALVLATVAVTPLRRRAAMLLPASLLGLTALMLVRWAGSDGVVGAGDLAHAIASLTPEPGISSRRLLPGDGAPGLLILARLVGVGALLALALAGWQRTRWTTGSDVPSGIGLRLALAPLAFAPLVIAGVDISHVYLLSLPFLSLSAASLLLGDIRRGPGAWGEVSDASRANWLTPARVAIAATVVLAICFVIVRLGNSRLDAISLSEATVATRISEEAPRGSLLVGLSSQLPFDVRAIGRHEFDSAGEMLDSGVPAGELVARVVERLEAHPGGAAYFVTSDGSFERLERSGLITADERARLLDDIARDPRLEVRSESTGVTVFTLASASGIDEVPR